MTRRYSPTVRRRRLSAVLRHLRHQNRLTLEGATDQLEWSRGRLAHMEGNKWTRPDIGNIRQLLDLYKVTDEERREAILELARQSRQRGWWTKFKDVFGTDSLVGFESEASVISTYQPIVIPGLLQTRGYAAASASASLTRPEEINRTVDARIARQEVLAGEQPPTVRAIIDESTLHRLPVEDGVAAGQIRHLIDQAQNPDITIQVLPFSAGLHPGISGPFVLLDFPDEMDAPIAFLEARTDALFLEEDDEVKEYRQVFDRLQAIAKSQSESIELMESLINKL
ncbi:XRE family transcriptional regulator [Nocardiopsis gilva YIM 90087]|uniref:XRE family transcriptional regulator n=1 Tax=Nocardiopsis gilva YIM 90087 TaxID=1235441 RepID=A0A223S030_9ACTN|nr:helix-turn-helix transcriptional regulator [Nocardiopsis gilva]ASU81481.1 XRE family transcriptional regulator [Nocardiopsis gilva YIM 90087]